jgi:hypothetical protein
METEREITAADVAQEEDSRPEPSPANAEQAAEGEAAESGPQPPEDLPSEGPDPTVRQAGL